MDSNSWLGYTRSFENQKLHRPPNFVKSLGPPRKICHHRPGLQITTYIIYCRTRIYGMQQRRRFVVADVEHVFLLPSISVSEEDELAFARFRRSWAKINFNDNNLVKRAHKRMIFRKIQVEREVRARDMRNAETNYCVWRLHTRLVNYLCVCSWGGFYNAQKSLDKSRLLSLARDSSFIVRAADFWK